MSHVRNFLTNLAATCNVDRAEGDVGLPEILVPIVALLLLMAVCKVPVMSRVSGGEDKAESTELIAQKTYAPYLHKYAELALRKRNARYLEWGPGTSSTIALQYFAPKNGYLIEHDPQWVLYHTRHILVPYPQVHFFLLSKFSRQFKWRERCDYSDLPRTWGKKFDLIMIDGKNRPQCLATAAAIVKPGGWVILHDSFREEYHPAVHEHFDVVDGGLRPGQNPEDPDEKEGTAVLQVKKKPVSIWSKIKTQWRLTQ